MDTHQSLVHDYAFGVIELDEYEQRVAALLRKEDKAPRRLAPAYKEKLPGWVVGGRVLFGVAFLAMLVLMIVTPFPTPMITVSLAFSIFGWCAFANLDETVLYTPSKAEHLDWFGTKGEHLRQQGSAGASGEFPIVFNGKPWPGVVEKWSDPPVQNMWRQIEANERRLQAIRSQQVEHSEAPEIVYTWGGSCPYDDIAPEHTIGYGDCGIWLDAAGRPIKECVSWRDTDGRPCAPPDGMRTKLPFG